MLGSPEKWLALLQNCWCCFVSDRGTQTRLFPECYGRLATVVDVPGLPHYFWLGEVGMASLLAGTFAVPAGIYLT